MKFICLIFTAFVFPSAVFGWDEPLRIALQKEDTLSVCVRFDRDVGHRFLPHCETWVVRAGSRSLMRYNALGIRDKDYSKKPKPGWIRILVMGDSGMAGPGLPEEKTAPREYERALRKLMGPKVEVINAGMEGYSTAQMLVRMEEFMQAYSPTHVLYQVGSHFTAMRDKIYFPHIRWEGDIPKGIDFFEHSDQMLGLRVGFLRAFYSWGCRFKSGEELARCLSRETVSLIKTMQDRAEKHGAKFEALMFRAGTSNSIDILPRFDSRFMRFFGWFTPDLKAGAQDFLKVAEKSGIRFLHYDFGKTEEERLPNDPHFNPKGSKRWGRDTARLTLSFLKN